MQRTVCIDGTYRTYRLRDDWNAWLPPAAHLQKNWQVLSKCFLRTNNSSSSFTPPPPTCRGSHSLPRGRGTRTRRCSAHPTPGPAFPALRRAGRRSPRRANPLPSGRWDRPRCQGAAAGYPGGGGTDGSAVSGGGGAPAGTPLPQPPAEP